MRRFITTFILLIFVVTLFTLPSGSASARPGEAVDDAYTVTLLHCNGSDGSTTFTDESGKTWTANGNAQIDTAQYPFSPPGSCLFDGSGDYISTADSADFYFNGDFTLDYRVRFNALPTTGEAMRVYNQYTDVNNRVALQLNNTSGTYFWRFIAVSGGTNLLTVDATQSGISTGTWYHIAFVRNGNNFMWFVNGTQIGTTVTDTDTPPNLGSSIYIGAFDLAGGWLNGWLDEYRISKGIARWTSNFTPPSGEYLAPTNTPTNTFTPTNTATNTATPTNTATSTHTNTPTNTATHTPGPTATYTDTPTNTATSTATHTATNTPTPTYTPTATATRGTPVMPTWYIEPQITYGEYMLNAALLGLCGVVLLAFFTIFVVILMRRKK